MNAEAAGLTDEEQTSKLLSRLQRRGLIHDAGLGQAHGEPNAWLLTLYGRRVADLTASRRALRRRGAGSSGRPQ